MKYVGTIRPMFPLAAFCESVFEQEGVYFRQNQHEHIITSFAPTVLTPDQILLYERPFDVAAGQPVIYTYLEFGESSRMEVGTYTSLFKRLFPLLQDEDMDPVQALLISRFCKLHTKTIKYCKKANSLGGVYFCPDHFLPAHYSGATLIPALFAEIQSLVELVFLGRKNYAAEHFRDFIYIDKKRVYISDYTFDFDAIADFIDKEPWDSNLRQQLFDLFIHYNIIPCSESDPVFISGQRNALWLAEIISIHQQAQIVKKMGFPIPESNPVSISYETTNKVHRYSEEDPSQVAAADERITALAQSIKYNLQA